MNEQLQQQLAEYLKAIAGAAKSGTDFVLTQAPLVVQEKVLYGRIVEPLGMLLGLAVLWGGWRLCVAGKPFYAKDDGAFIPLFMLRGVSMVAGGIVTVVQANATALVFAAPRLYILEWAMHLVSGK